MALKPTIYKFRVSLSDMNEDVYTSEQFTIALHPSEKPQRMLARILAFCMNAKYEPTFTKGLSTIEEPDLWKVEDDQSISHWIEVGEPEVERIKKATRLANKVSVYSFNSKSDVWWEKSKGKFGMLPASIFNFAEEGIDTLAEALERSATLSVMITGTSIFVDMGDVHVEIPFVELQNR